MPLPSLQFKVASGDGWNGNANERNIVDSDLQFVAINPHSHQRSGFLPFDAAQMYEYYICQYAA